MADIDLFLKIDGIEGEVQDVKHKGELRIEAITQSVGHSLTGAAGPDAGLSIWQDATFTMLVDKAYPKVFQACASGEKINKAVLTFRKAGKEQQEFLKMTFTDVLVSSCQMQGIPKGANVVPRVTFSLNFAQIDEEYRAQKPDGSLGGVVKYSYSIPKAPAGT